MDFDDSDWLDAVESAPEEVHLPDPAVVHSNKARWIWVKERSVAAQRDILCRGKLRSKLIYVW